MNKRGYTFKNTTLQMENSHVLLSFVFKEQERTLELSRKPFVINYYLLLFVHLSYQMTKLEIILERKSIKM